MNTLEEKAKAINESTAALHKAYEELRDLATEHTKLTAALKLMEPSQDKKTPDATILMPTGLDFNRAHVSVGVPVSTLRPFVEARLAACERSIEDVKRNVTAAMGE